MATSQPGYCQLSDVTNRLFAGQGLAAVPNDAVRDALLNDKIVTLSREFDMETGRPLGAYAPTYEARLYSGLGRQMLEIDELASVAKVEWNNTPTGVASWVDVTNDITAGRMYLQPIRFWPKVQFFRQYTWIVDPYRNGNYRITAVYGCVRPDMGAAQPAAPWEGLATAGAIQALAPDPTQASGWWITPHDVREAIATWVLYDYKATQAAFGDSGGQGVVAQNEKFSKGIPQSVQRVIDKYKGDKLHLALIGLDGSDAVEDAVVMGGGLADPGNPYYRWAGWRTPPGT